MDGISFSGTHTLRDLGFYLHKYPVISPPTPYTCTIDVPGHDGTIDLSTSLDGVQHYTGRKISLSLVYIGERDEWSRVYAELMRAVHGKTHEIIFDIDTSYKYIGKCTVGNPTYDKKYDFIVPITCECDAYKYELHESDYDLWLWDTFDFEYGAIRQYSLMKVNGTLAVTIIGSEKPSYPDIIVNSRNGAGMVMRYNGNEYDLVDGTNVLAGFLVGNNAYDVEFVGNGTVSIRFDCGVL